MALVAREAYNRVIHTPSGLYRREIRILRKVYGGRGTVSDDLIASIDPFFSKSVGTTEADAARAGALLDDAGWRIGAGGRRMRGGLPLTLDLIDFGGIANLATIELVRDDLAKLGIELTTRTLDGSVFNDPGGIEARGTYESDIYGQSLSSDVLDDVFNCCRWVPAGANASRYCNPRVDRLLDEAQRTYDRTSRAALYLRARRLISADVPVIPPIHRTIVNGVRTNVTGFAPNAFSTFGDIMKVDVR